MTIRNLDSHFESMWNWHFLNRNCFNGTGIKLGDADGIVERNGYVLVIETKSANAELKLGQRIMAEKASAFACRCGCVTGQLTVLIVHGDPRAFSLGPWVYSIETVHSGNSTTQTYEDGAVGRKQLEGIVRRWFECADAKSFEAVKAASDG